MFPVLALLRAIRILVTELHFPVFDGRFSCWTRS